MEFSFLFFSFLFTKQHEAWRRRKRRRRCNCRSFVSLKDVGFDLAKGLRGLRRVGFTFLGGWMDLFWENNGRRCGSSRNGSC